MGRGHNYVEELQSYILTIEHLDQNWLASDRYLFVLRFDLATLHIIIFTILNYKLPPDMTTRSRFKAQIAT